MAELKIKDFFLKTPQTEYEKAYALEENHKARLAVCARNNLEDSKNILLMLGLLEPDIKIVHPNRRQHR